MAPVRCLLRKGGQTVLDSSYRKDRQAVSVISRSILGMKTRERMPTIREYETMLGCSRGVVQNALTALQESGAITLDKRGKQGTFILSADEDMLFDAANLQYFTGSMPAPLNLHLAGLATGVCQSMGRCPAPFTFAFVQGAQNRANALLRGIYDFAVVTMAAAQEHIRLHPELEIAFPLTGCEYSPPYILYINRPGVTEIQDGMTVALDTSSTDHAELTKQLCRGKDVKFVPLPYIAAHYALYAGEVDCAVFRNDSDPTQSFQELALSGTKTVLPANISSIAINGGQSEEMQLPVVLVSIENYGIADILRNYLSCDLISYIQKRVISHQMAPQFY